MAKKLALVTDIYTWYPHKMKDSKNLDEVLLGEISFVDLKFTLQISLWLNIFIFRINTLVNRKFLIAMEISTAGNWKEKLVTEFHIWNKSPCALSSPTPNL